MGMLVTSETDPYMISFQSVGTTRMACQIFDIENQITLGLNTVASFEVTKCDKKDHRCASLLNKDNVVIFTLEERPEIDNSEQIEEEQGTP